MPQVLLFSLWTTLLSSSSEWQIRKGPYHGPKKALYCPFPTSRSEWKEFSCIFHTGLLWFSSSCSASQLLYRHCCMPGVPLSSFGTVSHYFLTYICAILHAKLYRSFSKSFPWVSASTEVWNSLKNQNTCEVLPQFLERVVKLTMSPHLSQNDICRTHVQISKLSYMSISSCDKWGLYVELMENQYKV